VARQKAVKAVKLHKRKPTLSEVDRETIDIAQGISALPTPVAVAMIPSVVPEYPGKVIPPRASNPGKIPEHANPIVRHKARENSLLLPRLKRKSVIFRITKRNRRILTLPSFPLHHPDRSLPVAIPIENNESPKPARKIGKNRTSLRKETIQ
jgi:hypothetical protein